MGGLPAVLVGAQVSPVDGDGGRIADRTRGTRLRPHAEQHAPHVRMHNDRAGSFRRFRCAALLAVARIGEGLLR